MAERFEATGALVSISGGSIGGLASAFTGSIFNISGGTVGSNFLAGNGSIVNISGGSISILFEAANGSVVNLSGGAMNHILRTHPGSRFNIDGGEFRLDGVPISGLTETGSARAIDIPAGAVFSGTLVDGTPFAFSGQDSDIFAAGTLTLRRTSLPPPASTSYYVPNDPAPVGLRTGQSLVLEDGGALGNQFNANWGTAVTINGGRIGDDFEANGAVVNISGGTVGWRFDAFYGSLVNITGGTFDVGFTANRGSVVNISGGMFERHFRANFGSVVNIAGGAIGDSSYTSEGSVVNLSAGSLGNDFRLYGGILNMSGGVVANELGAYGGSVVNISGGTIGDRFQALGHVNLTGSDFRLDGIPISGLDLGSVREFDIPAGSALSGTLVDGTPFVFSSDDGDLIQPGVLRLHSWYPPETRAGAIYVPGEPAPTGVRAGQTLMVRHGGTLDRNLVPARAASLPSRVAK